jgi:hypothetical protein
MDCTTRRHTCAILLNDPEVETCPQVETCPGESVSARLTDLASRDPANFPHRGDAIGGGLEWMVARNVTTGSNNINVFRLGVNYKLDWFR